MANSMRWRYGETNPVMAPVGAATVVEIGDLLFLDSGSAKPASDLQDQGSALANQSQLHSVFLGVAMQCSSAGETDPIRAATTGVFEYDCTLDTYNVGDLVGGCENAGGTALEDQKVADAASASAAIGRSVSRVSPASSRILIDVVSSVVKGGVQDIA